MKSFISSVIFLAIVLSGVVFNSFYAKKLYSGLKESLDSFPQSASDADTKNIMQKTRKNFDDHDVYFYLTLAKTDYSELMYDISDTFAYYNAKDSASYSASLEKTKLKIDRLKSSESFSLKEIFGN